MFCCLIADKYITDAVGNHDNAAVGLCLCSVSMSTVLHNLIHDNGYPFALLGHILYVLPTVTFCRCFSILFFFQILVATILLGGLIAVVQVSVVKALLSVQVYFFFVVLSS